MILLDLISSVLSSYLCLNHEVTKMINRNELSEL